MNQLSGLPLVIRQASRMVGFAVVFTVSLMIATSVLLAPAAHAADESGSAGESEVEVSVPSERPAPASTTPPGVTSPPRATSPTTSTGGTSWGSGTAPAAKNPTSAGGDAAPTEPPIGTAPASGEAGEADHKAYAPGDAVRVTGKGFTPGEQVQVVLFGSAQLIGNYVAGDDGTVSVRFELPGDIKAGSHSTQLTGWESGRIVIAKFVVANDAALAVQEQEQDGALAFWFMVAGIGLAAAVVIGGGWWAIATMRRAPVSALPVGVVA